MLTDRQKLTIKHLKDIKNITEVMDIIKYCIEALDRPRKTTEHMVAVREGRATNTKPPRKHGKEYYQEIINHYASSTNERMIE